MKQMNMEKSKTFSERKSLVSEEEQPYKLPDNWCWTKIKYICNLYNGKSFKSSDWVDNGLPIVRIQNLNNPNAEYNYYNGEVEEKFYLKGEELLFAWSGTPGTSFGAHIWKKQEAVLNQHIFKIVFDEERIDKVYLMYAINQQLNTLISNVHGGVGLQHITKRDFEETLIPLAPLSEQKRIVWRIEDMFDKLNEAKQMLQGAIENIDIFKKNILHDAFSGKLTEQWRKEQGIKYESRKMKKLSVLCDSLSYGTSRKSQKQGSVAVIRMGNLQNGEIDWSDIVYTDNQDDIRKYILKPGDVLFNRTNSSELVGKTSIYRGECPAIYAGYLLKLDYGKELIGEYLNYIMNSPQAKAYCNTVKSNGVNQSNINAKKIGNFVIPVPPIDEQKEIVRILNYFFNKIEKAKELCQLMEQINAIKEHILNLAFCGMLGTNDINEEKAEESLKYIMLFKEESLKQKNKKVILTKGEQRMTQSLIDLLKEEDCLTPEKLKSKTEMDIDEFYAQLKQLVEQNIVEEVRKDGEIYLGVINHAN